MVIFNTCPSHLNIRSSDHALHHSCKFDMNRCMFQAPNPIYQRWQILCLPTIMTMTILRIITTQRWRWRKEIVRLKATPHYAHMKIKHPIIRSMRTHRAKFSCDTTKGLGIPKLYPVDLFFLNFFTFCVTVNPCAKNSSLAHASCKQTHQKKFVVSTKLTHFLDVALMVYLLLFNNCV